MELVEFGRLAAKHRAELEGGERDPFGAAGLALASQRKDLHVALRAPDGRLAASTGLLVTDVEVASAGAFAVVGIGGVIVAARHRGQGLARTVLEAALERAATLGPAIAVLLCHDDRAGLYERLDFETVAPPVRVQQPSGTIVMPQRTMWRALRDGAVWPSGRVDVRSLPF